MRAVLPGLSRVAATLALTGTTLAVGALAVAPTAQASTPVRSGSVSAADQARIQHWAPVMRRIRACESSGNYHISTGNGYYGAYQFLAATWHGLGYSGLPSQASPAQQDAAAAKLLSRVGTGPWAGCL